MSKMTLMTIKSEVSEMKVYEFREIPVDYPKNGGSVIYRKIY